jgi:CheY-like chemotaxis protein
MGLRVLVADDDALARRYFVEALGALGVGVVEATSGAEALVALAGTAVDVLIADLRMPGPSGPELAYAVRERCGSDAPRLVAMSGELGPGTRDRLVAAGYADAFEKPIERAALAALLGLRTEAEPLLAPSTPTPSAAVLDDDAALAALGSATAVVALRRLMLEDLPAQRETLRRTLAAQRHEHAADLLHRFRAACGFCGTPRLAQATAALQRALAEDRSGLDVLHEDWEFAAADVEAALAQR